MRELFAPDDFPVMPWLLIDGAFEVYALELQFSFNGDSRAVVCLIVKHQLLPQAPASSHPQQLLKALRLRLRLTSPENYHPFYPTSHRLCHNNRSQSEDFDPDQFPHRKKPGG